MLPITIITVCYNASSSIEATIKSVAKQNPNCQYIIIDGGSTDNTVEIINNHKSVVDILVSEPDNGIYDAMNKGWNLVKEGNYILFLGSGDKIIKLPNPANFEKANIIYGNVLLGNNLVTGKCDFRLKLGSTVHHQALLIKKSIHVAPPFCLDFPIYADFDFNQRLLKAKHQFIKDDSFLSFALEGGISAKKDEQQMLNVVNKNYGFFYQFLAKLYYKLQDARKSR